MSESNVTRDLIMRQGSLNGRADIERGTADYLNAIAYRTNRHDPRVVDLNTSAEEMDAQAEALEPVIALSRRLDAVVDVLATIAEYVDLKSPAARVVLEQALAALRERAR